MKKIALITGASSGLGKEYVHQLQVNREIDEFWIVARRKDKLEELQKECIRPVRCISLDLCKEESIQELSLLLEVERPEIKILICAAGMGSVGTAQQNSLEQSNHMIDLNIKALVDVTRICLPYCHEGTRILEIGSVAGFMPLPGFNIYAATKAFVQSYTKSLHVELKKQGIKVTCVCPYWVKDTEFISVSQEGASENGYESQFMPQLTRDVVTKSLADSEKNRWISTPGLIPSALRVGSKIVPHALITKILEKNV